MELVLKHYNAATTGLDTDQVVQTTAAVEVQQPLDDLNSLVLGAIDIPTETEKELQMKLDIISNLSISVHDDIPADVNTLKIGEVETFAREGLHFVKAKAKQGKTSMLAIIESIYINPNGQWGKIQRIGKEVLKVCHVDTEQKPYDTQRFKKQVFHLAGTDEENVGENYRIFNMRSIIDNDSKKELIEALLKEYKPDVLILDGIVDLLDNFNEIDESKQLIAWLMQLADQNKIVLFCVLHTNKNSDDHNMRGHLGTMSEQKCDTTTECVKDDKNGFVKVSCAVSRHCPYPDWSFTWDSHGNLIDADQIRYETAIKQAEEQREKRDQKSKDLKESRKQTMLSLVKNHGGCISRSDLTELLLKEFDVSRKVVSPLITKWINEKVIYEVNKMIQLSPQCELFDEV